MFDKRDNFIVWVAKDQLVFMLMDYCDRNFCKKCKNTDNFVPKILWLLRLIWMSCNIA